ncbi:hypothetical protein ACB092_04G074200 [Castanea dentata]
MSSDTKARVTILENILGVPKEGEQLFVCDRLDGEVATKVKVPKPKPFNSARNAKDLENFLWDMEQYFKVVRVPSQEMVTITSMHLSGDAKLW